MVTRTHVTVVWRKDVIDGWSPSLNWVDRHAEIPEEVKDVFKGEF